jgi:hypothetical protein
MVNSEFIKDVQKGMSGDKLNQVLDAGTTPRRYEPECGVNKHNERIHRESKYADTHKNLPFTFRKPHKPIGRSTYLRCDNCGKPYRGTTATHGIICNGCHKFSTVSKVTEEELNIDWEG